MVKHHFLTARLDQNWRLTEEDGVWYVQTKMRRGGVFSEKRIFAIKIEDVIYIRRSTFDWVHSPRKYAIKAMIRSGIDFEKHTLIFFLDSSLSGLFLQNRPLMHGEKPFGRFLTLSDLT